MPGRRFRVVSRARQGDWVQHGSCHNASPAVAALFFSEHNGDIIAAKKICDDCPVREACLEWAIANHEDHGVWGGASERQRREIRRRQKRAS